MGPRAGLDRCGKYRPPLGFDPRTVQPVASRYTDYATRPTLYSRSIPIDIDAKKQNILDIVRHLNSFHPPLSNVNIKIVFRGHNRPPSSGKKKERPTQLDPKDKAF